jgi:isocitrate dehydrogenase
MAKIIYTYTDEAPMLATYSFLPIIEAFAKAAGVEVETRDISLAGRILAAFADLSCPRTSASSDASPSSASWRPRPRPTSSSCPTSRPRAAAQGGHRRAAGPGLRLPDYPTTRRPTPSATRARYDKVKGSAVNPVLREGNSDRRAPLP